MKEYIQKSMAGLLFLAIIFGFMVYDFLLPDIGFSENENRMLTKKPDLTVEAVLSGTYGTDVEKWLTDQFPFRNRLIAVKTFTELAVGQTYSNHVYFGRDGYLLEALTDAEIDKERAERNVKAIQTFGNQMEEQLGSGHSKVMIVPTSALVLSEKLPAFAPVYDQKGLLETIASGLKSGIFVDAEENLKAHKTEDIYYRTDHHWTTLGAYYGYQAFMGLFTTQAPKLIPVTDEFYGTLQSRVGIKGKADTISVYEPEQSIAFTVNYNLGERITDSFYELSYLEKKDKYGMFFDGNQPVVQISGAKDKEGKLLILKDSYANCFAPFVAEQYEEVHMIDLRYFNMPVSAYIEQYGITDVLVLYNASTVVNDRHITGLLR